MALIKSTSLLAQPRPVRDHLVRRTGLSVVAFAFMVLVFTSIPGRTQVVGDEAEMDRLQARAEELMANEDPEGAAMSMGRAALMAKHLHQKAGTRPNAPVYHGAELLFRAQEHAYRALALYRRAGGQPPASSGVCHTLQAARNGVRRAAQTLQIDPETRGGLTSADVIRLDALHATTDDWLTVVESMASDFQCL